jgi:hypothetical protein
VGLFALSWAPLPRVQAVDLRGKGARVVDGVPLWREAWRSGPLEDFGCDAPRRALLLGSSIFAGVELDPAETLGPRLQAEVPGLCVHNLSQPAFAFQNQLAAAQEAPAGPLAGRPPSVIVWEMWANSAHTHEVIGDTAYNFGTLALDGGPPNPLGLSHRWNRALFRWVSLYRHVNVRIARPPTVAPDQDKTAQDFAAGPLQGGVDLAEALGAQLIVVYMPPSIAPPPPVGCRPTAATGPSGRPWSRPGPPSSSGGRPCRARRSRPCASTPAATSTRRAPAGSRPCSPGPCGTVRRARPRPERATEGTPHPGDPRCRPRAQPWSSPGPSLVRLP